MRYTLLTAIKGSSLKTILTQRNYKERNNYDFILDGYGNYLVASNHINGICLYPE